MKEQEISYATLPEVMISQVARTIRDGELVFHGYGSPVPALAMLLARRTHAPHMVHIEGATYGVNPDPPFLPPTSNDWSLSRGSVLALGITDLFDIAARGDMGRMFLSGVQVDRYGNLNVTAIGSAAAPRVKLPGSGGGCNLSADVQHITIWTTGHRASLNKAGKRQYRFVKQIDFISSIGHVARDGRARAALGLRGGGPEWVVTELGVFDFDPGTHVLRLRRLYPDTTVQDVLDNTEFEPVIAPDVSVVSLPSPADVALIRRFDPLNTHQREFKSTDVSRRFSLQDSQ
ncbi:MAG TPA: CoA-transferase [Ktedonobacteraceae bacterium]|nr:CoA-transferase [Ktedonobacteraceae bacterium]